MGVRSSIDIGAPAPHVWEVISRFRRWPDWGPTVTAVDSDADVVRVGVTGRVRTPLRIWLPFEITSVDPGRSWTWQIAGVPATGHIVHATGPSTCRVEFTAPAWGAPYAVVLRRGLRRLRAIAEGR